MMAAFFPSLTRPKDSLARCDECFPRTNRAHGPVGAFIGMATSGIILANPMISTLVMLAAVIGLQFGIAANRNSGVGVALLLLMTGLLGWWLGPILNYVLAMRNGMQLANLSGQLQNIVIGALLLAAIVAGNLIGSAQEGGFRPAKLRRRRKGVTSDKRAEAKVLVDSNS